MNSIQRGRDRPSRPQLIALAVCFLAASMFHTASAEAARNHRLLLTEEIQPGPVAVDSATHEFYVATIVQGQGRVAKFNFDGEPDPVNPELSDVSSTPRGIAVDNSGPPDQSDVYVADPVAEAVQQFDSAGQPTSIRITVADIPPNGTVQAGGLPPVVNMGKFEPQQIAVNSEGELFVADAGGLTTSTNAIDVFKPTGEFIRQIGTGLEARAPTGIAVVGADVYVGLSLNDGVLGKPGLYRLNAATGECIPVDCSPVDPNAVYGVGADQSAGTVYATGQVNPAFGNEGKLSEYDAATGDLLGVIHPEALHRPEAVAEDEASGELVVGDQGSPSQNIKIFGAVEVVPDVKTLTPEEVADSSVTLKGEIGAAELTGATCSFQYVDEAAFKARGFEAATEVPCEPAGPFSGTTMEAVHAEVEGLRGGTTYHERIVGTNANGENVGEDVPFLTDGPTVANTEAIEVTDTSATLRGTVDPNGSPATYGIQYLTQAAFEAGAWAGATEVPAGGGQIGLSAAGNGDLEAGSSATGSGRLDVGPFTTGTGTLSEGSDEVISLSTGEGTFAVGQPISGKGIPAGATIVAVGTGTLTLSAPAAATGSGVALAAGMTGTFAEGSGNLSAGSDEVAAPATSGGAFEVGQPISGKGIPVGTTITAVEPGGLVLSALATSTEAGVALAAGSILVTSPKTNEGTFAVGQPISGDVAESLGAGSTQTEGIVDGTKIVAVDPGALVLSAPAASSATGVTLAAGSILVTSLSTTERAFRKGQAIAGSGVPRGATIRRVSAGGTTLVLSAEAEQTVSGAALTATEPLAASEAISGLVPGVTYRFRILAISADGTTEGQEVEFTAQQSPFPELPDDRAYEQVSPTDKNGTNIQGAINSTQASLDGERITFFSLAGIPGGEGAQNFPTYMASRSSTGWSTQGLMPPASYGSTGAVLGWTEDLGDTYDYASRAFEEGELLLRTGPGSLAQIGKSASGGKNPFAYAGSSRGGAVALLESVNGPKVAVDQNVLAYDGESGRLIVAGVLNDGTVPPGGAMAGPYAWFHNGSATSLGGALNNSYTQQGHAISSDGSEVFFTAGGTGQLYVRINPFGEPQELTPAECREPGNEMACTIRVSAPEAGITDPATPAAFVGASADGRLVYFLDKGKLTTNSTAGSGYDLYRYEVTSGALTDLTPDATDKRGAQVEGILGIGGPTGEDAYFVAAGRLVADEEATQAPAGKTNLYALHGTALEFVTQLGTSLEEQLDWFPTSKEGAGEQVARPSRISADGQTLLFRSAQSLTTYGSRGKPELYLYRTGQGVDCVSCNPSGEAPSGPAGVQEIPPLGDVALSRFYSILTRNLSADGQRVFFDSPDRLVSADRNEVNDAYEWEADGEGSCASTSQDGGCLFLISGGAAGAAPSYFGDADEKGENVFFLTAQRLVAQDKDELVDVYDAKVGGGIPSQNQVPTVPCESEAGCRAAAAPNPPVSPTPASSSFHGEGNPKPSPTCKKGQVRKHGKCMKKPKKHMGKKKPKQGKKNKGKQSDRKAGKGKKGGKG
jgi:hypothetical protein